MIDSFDIVKTKNRFFLGAMCIENPWPGMARTIFNDHDRFKKTYYSDYPGYYFSGDGVERSDKGWFRITGRMDDVINISGHRLSTAEIESVLAENENVSEAAVVGFDHNIKGDAPAAFVILKQNSNIDRVDLETQLNNLVREKIAKFATPDKFLIVKDLPKTRSGKIMRRILKKIASGEKDQFGDTSTLADPSVVNEILETYVAKYS